MHNKAGTIPQERTLNDSSFYLHPNTAVIHFGLSSNINKNGKQSAYHDPAGDRLFINIRGYFKNRELATAA